MNSPRRLGRLAAIGSILASLAPACGDEPRSANGAVVCATDNDCTPLGQRYTCQQGHCALSANDLKDGAAGTTSLDAGAQPHVDPTPDASTTPNVDAGTAGTYTGNCQAHPDPTPVLLPNIELDPTAIARAAAILSVCSLSDDGVSRIVTELWSTPLSSRNFNSLSVMQARCLADARCGCEAAEHCLGFQLETGVPPGCQSSCNGDVFRGCGDPVDLIEGYAFHTDCAKTGLHCHPTGICVDDVQATCDGAEPPSCPVGARPQFCAGGVLREGPDCSALGLGCADGQCQGTGATCTNGDEISTDRVSFEDPTCQGGTLQACVNGKLATMTCAEQGPGFDCQSVDGVPFCGLASECLPADAEGYRDEPTNACDGTRLTFCNAGRLETIDCVDLGFTGCGLDYSGERYACSPGLGS